MWTYLGSLFPLFHVPIPGPPSHQPRLFIMEVLYGNCLTLYLYFTGKNINALCVRILIKTWCSDVIRLTSLFCNLVWRKIWGLISRVQIFLLSSVYWNSVRSKTFVFVENINTTTTFNKNSLTLQVAKYNLFVFLTVLNIIYRKVFECLPEYNWIDTIL